MESRPTSRQLLLAKEGLCCLLALAALGFAAAFCPLEPVLSGQAEGSGADAPWLFMGLQELLRRFSPVVGGLLIPLAGLAVLAAAPWLSGEQGAALPSARRPRPLEWLIWLVLAGWAALTLGAMTA